MVFTMAQPQQQPTSNFTINNGPSSAFTPTASSHRNNTRRNKACPILKGNSSNNSSNNNGRRNSNKLTDNKAFINLNSHHNAHSKIGTAQKKPLNNTNNNHNMLSRRIPRGTRPSRSTSNHFSECERRDDEDKSHQHQHQYQHQYEQQQQQQRSPDPVFEASLEESISNGTYQQKFYEFRTRFASNKHERGAQRRTSPTATATVDTCITSTSTNAATAMPTLTTPQDDFTRVMNLPSPSMHSSRTKQGICTDTNFLELDLENIESIYMMSVGVKPGTGCGTVKSLSVGTVSTVSSSYSGTSTASRRSTRQRHVGAARRRLHGDSKITQLVTPNSKMFGGNIDDDTTHDPSGMMGNWFDTMQVATELANKSGWDAKSGFYFEKPFHRRMSDASAVSDISFIVSNVADFNEPVHHDSERVEC